MKVLIVHNALNDSRSVSGVVRHYAFVAEALNAKGHEVDFYLAGAGFPQLKELAPSSQLISSDSFFDATHHIEKTWTYFPAYFWRALTCFFTWMPKRYDVVYASGQFILEVWCARILAWRMKCPWMVKIQHVLGAQTKRQGLINGLFLWTERIAAKWIRRKSIGVMCISNVVAKDWNWLEKELGLPPSETLQVGCGIEFEKIPDGAAVAKKFDVVFLGRMHEQKGVFDIAPFWKRVLEECPEARLAVIGEGPHRKAMQNQLKEHGIEKQVEVFGGVSEDDKRRLLAESRIGISLSYEEGWGISVTEFLATGLPVVGYALPVFEEAFPGQIDSVPLGDAVGAGAKVAALLRNPDRISKEGAGNREFAKDLDYKKVGEGELQVIETFLDRRESKAT